MADNLPVKLFNIYGLGSLMPVVKGFLEMFQVLFHEFFYSGHKHLYVLHYDVIYIYWSYMIGEPIPEFRNSLC